MRSLSDTRRRILGTLAWRNTERDGHPSAREIAEQCGEHRRASDWANGPLREMAYHGLVERVGSTLSSAGTWAITDRGRQVYEASVASVRADRTTASPPPLPTPRSPA